MKNKLTPLLTIILGIALSAGAAKAQILTNGSFETTTTSLAGGGKSNDFTTATGWQNISGAAQNDTGLQGNGGNGTAEDGNVFAFEQSGQPGAFQITGTKVAVGDVLTLTYWAVDTYNGATQAVSLLSASSTSSAFSSSTVLATDTTALPSGNTNGPYTEYTLTDTVGAGQAGYVGVSFVTLDSSGGTGGGAYAQYDNFVVTDTPAVPEPSAYALLLVGAGALVFVRRFRTSSV